MKEKILKTATVVFLRRDGKVLLAMKEAKIGAGCWNGYGGGVKPGETLEQAAIREVNEESKPSKLHKGVIVREEDLKKVAVVDFHNTTAEGIEFVCTVHFYFADQWTGEPKSSKEMTNPTWFSVNKLPLGKMMPADRQFVPLIMHGQKIRARAWYGPSQKKLLRKKIEIELLVE